MTAQDVLIRHIKTNGAISISTFMDIALSHPKHGYYQKKDPFGHAGDFVTSPEISQVFGELIGIWCTSIWQQMGQPEHIGLVEMGPGRGTLMQDLLRGTKFVPGFHQAATIFMIETSPVLTQLQQRKLHSQHPNISWHTTLDQLPPYPLIFIANELLDALPICQYVKERNRWYERKIALNASGSLTFILEETSHLVRLADAPNGTLFEECPAMNNIIKTLEHHIEHYKGAALFIDYGYEEPAYQETLQAVKDHQYHDILTDIGDSDITAHVNFSALKRAIRQLPSYGPVTQAQFLHQLGIQTRAESLIKNASIEQRNTVIEGICRLIAEDQMGHLFKAFAFTHPSISTPIGFLA